MSKIIKNAAVKLLKLLKIDIFLTKKYINIYNVYIVKGYQYLNINSYVKQTTVPVPSRCPYIIVWPAPHCIVLPRLSSLYPQLQK